MSTKVAFGSTPWMAGTMEIPTARGPLYGHHGEVFGLQRLSTDAIGTFTITLKNAVVGSRYRIARSGDNSLATPTGSAEGTVPGVSGVADVSITLDYYSGGSANNDLKIDVRKGTSAPKYKPFQTFATAAAGTVLAYCAQEADPIA